MKKEKLSNIKQDSLHKVFLKNLELITQNNGTIAPVMRFETLRTMLEHTAIHNWKLWQFDIKGAYLHGYLEEELYMAQPPSYGDDSQ